MLARRLSDFSSMGWLNPFADMQRMMAQMNLLTGDVHRRPRMVLFPSRVFPAVNITENKDKYYVRAELPGIKPDEIDLQVDGRNLTISGVREIRSEGDNARYHRREREAGKFSRVIDMPGDIEADRIDAKLINGVLTVELSKAEASKPRQILVN